MLQAQALSATEILPEIFAGRGVGTAGEGFGGALGDHLATVFAALGAHINHPVGGFDDVEIMLNDNHRVAAVHEFAEDGEQALDVGGVEAGGGLV